MCMCESHHLTNTNYPVFLHPNLFTKSVKHRRPPSKLRQLFKLILFAPLKKRERSFVEGSNFCTHTLAQDTAVAEEKEREGERVKEHDKER